MAHPSIIQRLRPPVPERVRVCVYVAEPARRAWVDRELQALGAVVQNGRSIEELVAALVEDPPPRPQVLIAELDALSAEELEQLARIRQLGWFGSVFAVGRASMKVRRELQVERVFMAPLDDNALRAALGTVSHDAQTMRISRISG